MDKRILAVVIIVLVVLGGLFIFNGSSDKQVVVQNNNEKLVIETEKKKVFQLNVEKEQEVVVEEIVVQKDTPIKLLYHFEFNEFELSDSMDLDNYLQGANVKSITVVGYTDSLGSEDYNMELAFKRANSFKKKFQKYNIKIKYLAKGESNPIASNETEEGRALNRRVEILFN